MQMKKEKNASILFIQQFYSLQSMYFHVKLRRVLTLLNMKIQAQIVNCYLNHGTLSSMHFHVKQGQDYTFVVPWNHRTLSLSTLWKNEKFIYIFCQHLLKLSLSIYINFTHYVNDQCKMFNVIFSVILLSMSIKGLPLQLLQLKAYMGRKIQIGKKLASKRYA